MANIMDLKLYNAARFDDADGLRDCSIECLSHVTAGGNTLLHIAAKFGHQKSASQLFSLPALDSPSTLLLKVNSNRNTPLHCAAQAGHASFVSLLITQMNCLGNKKDVLRMKNKQGDTALHLAVRNCHLKSAVRNCHLEVVRKLMKEDGDMATVENNLGEFPLYIAAEKASLDITRCLRRYPSTGLGRKTALHAAVSRSKAIAEYLLKERPELSKERDESGATPLLYVASSGDLAMLRLLLEKDPSTTLRLDNDGMSPLHVAAAMGHVGVIDVILQSRPDSYELTDDKGQNFLHAAVRKKRMAVVSYVLGSERLEELLSQPDDNGNTPLHLAIISRNLEIVQILVKDKRVAVNERNHEGCTPLDLAYSIVESTVGHRMYQIMKDLNPCRLTFSSQRLDLLEKQDPKHEQEEINQCRATASNLSVVAVLIATVTFAAAFTLPGGYKNDPGPEQGMAVLIKKGAFKAFLISDSLAMVSSIIVTFLLIETGSIYHDIRLQSLETSKGLLKFSVMGMMVAFVTGTYTVVSADCMWLAIIICMIVCIVTVAIYAITIWPFWYNEMIKLLCLKVQKVMNVGSDSKSVTSSKFENLIFEAMKRLARIIFEAMEPCSVKDFETVDIPSWFFSERPKL